MDIYEIINFTNYDIIKNNKFIKPHVNKSTKYSYILYDTYDIYSKKIFKIKNINYENIIAIDLDLIIKDISTSYLNLEELQKQFILDIKRSYMTYNGHIIKDIQSLLDYLELKYRNTNLEKEILMLSTQSVFAIPFFIIQSQFASKELYLAEITDLDMKKYKILKKYKIDILKYNIKLEKYLRLFKFTKSNQCITKYLVKIIIDINLIKNDRYFILNYYFFN